MTFARRERGRLREEKEDICAKKKDVCAKLPGENCKDILHHIERLGYFT